MMQDKLDSNKALDIDRWKYFSLDEIFSKIEYGKICNTSVLEKGDDIYYIGAKKNNNGLMFKCKYDSTYVSSGNCIALICDGQGSVGFNNYIEDMVFCSKNIALAYSEHLNRYNALFLVTILDKERFRYSYGRKRKKFLKASKIKLPYIVKDNKIMPDFLYMENYIKSLNINMPITKNLNPINKDLNLNIELSKDKWDFFLLSSLFEIKTGSRLTKEEQKLGTTPFIGAISVNNGVANTIDKAPNHKGNTISLSYNGSIGEAFYQEHAFYASDDVNVLYPKFPLNKYIALFICTILKEEKFKYFFARKFTLKHMQKTKIKLPKKNNEVDFAYMEEFIKSLPYADLI